VPAGSALDRVWLSTLDDHVEEPGVLVHDSCRRGGVPEARAARSAGKPVGVNAFDPAVAQSYLDAGASFVLVGADVAILARGTEALAARFSCGGDEERASY